MTTLTITLAVLPLSALAIGLLAVQRQHDSRQLRFVRARHRR